MTVWFDVEDLFYYFRSGNKRISGIQRLTFEIYRAAHEFAGEKVGFVRHGNRPRSFVLVDWPALAAEFEAQEGPHDTPPHPAPNSPGAEPPPPSGSAARRLARALADRLPGEVRRPLILASVMQVQAVAALGLSGVNLALSPARAAARRSRRLAPVLRRLRAGWRHRPPEPAAADFASLAQPGDTLLVLGAPWMRERYSSIARWLRDERRMRFGVLMHDLVPVRRPEWCHWNVPRVFRDWYSDVLPFCDIVLANSRHTAGDVEAFARESGIVLPGPVLPVPVGTGFGRAVPVPDPAQAGSPPAEPGYVLFVSTLEARKNHLLAVRLWQRLLQEEQAGLRAPGSVPDLVFAGGIGWLVSDLLEQLDNTEWLGGRVRMVRNPSDAELRALYRGCLFTFFPSLYEGWGLPVTESLALGKPCLTSDAAALPEAGGPLCRYFDPEDLGSAYRAVTALLEDRPALAAWEAQVRREFRPTPWAETARVLLDAVAALEPAE